MTYEEIVRRVNTKSSICPECGCFISSLLDCCPACGYSASTYSKITGGKVFVSGAEYKIAGGKTFTSGNATPRTKLPPELETRFDLYDSYINGEIDSMRFRDAYQALGGNSATDNISSVTQSDYSNHTSNNMPKYTPDVGRPVMLYKDNKPFRTEYVPDVDYTAYYKSKTDAFKAQQHTTQLYYEAIKALSSYSGSKAIVDILDEEIERVKDHYL